VRKISSLFHFVLIPLLYQDDHLLQVMVLRSGKTAMQSGEAMMKNVIRFLKDKSGATAIEYGLIAALIAVAVIGGVTQLGQSTNQTFTNIADTLDGAAGN
jgi:pilus assembly protein Flp/PilA